MADIKKIKVLSDTYNIKDETARNEVNDINVKLLPLNKGGRKSFAHRGLSTEMPENTIASVYKAGYHQCYGVEIDAQVTSDGEIVIMHDLTVDRMTDGTGTINELTASYIDSLTIDAGANIDYVPTQHVPHLYEILNICNEFNMYIMIELKGTWSTGNYETLVNLLKEYNYIDKSIVISFNLSQLQEVRNANSNVELALLWDDSLTSNILNSVAAVSNCGMSLNYVNNSNINTDYLEFMKTNNIPFGFWTVNDKSIATNLYKNNIGCSFMVSNGGLGDSVKEYTKQIIAHIQSNGIVPWMVYSPNTELCYWYDFFTVTVKSAEDKEYHLTYDTQFPGHLPSYSTCVVANLEGSYKNEYSLWAKGQTNTGFDFRIVDHEGNALTYNELVTAVGELPYVTITVTGY